MITAQVSDKGQITLPVSIRKALGLKPRAKVDIEVKDDVIILRPLKSVRESYGVFREAAKGKTSDWDEIRAEMYSGIAEEYEKKLNEQ